jgi:hexulose-6-phosphate isomerase
MKLAVSLWTVYGWSLPELVSDEVLRSLAELGSQGIELVFDDGPNSADALLDGRPKLGELMAELGLGVPSIATALFWRDNVAAQDESVRGRALELVRGGCGVAHAYRAPVLMVLAGQLEPGTEYARCYATSVETMREAGQIAAEMGVVLGVENVNGGLLRSPGEYARYIADVAHPSVQAYLDLANGMLLGSSNTVEWISAVQGHLVAVHAKDYDQTLNGILPCGLGDVDWQVTMGALRGAGFDGYLTIETPPRAGLHQPTRAAGLHAARTSLQWLAQWTRA